MNKGRTKYRRIGYQLPAGLIIAAGLVLLGLFFLYRQKPLPLPVKERYYTPGFAYNTWLYQAYDVKQDNWDNNYVWFATGQGLRRMHKKEYTWKVYDMQDGLWSSTVTSLSPDKHNIWMGTWHGLASLDRVTGRIKAWTPKDGLKAKKIFTVLAEKNGVWAGTNGHGLYYLDHHTKSFRTVTQANGLASDVVYCITKWLGQYYLGHDNGSISYGDGQSEWRILEFKKAVSNSGKIQIWKVLFRDHSLWAATSNSGVWEYNFPQKKWKQHSFVNGFTAKGAYTLIQDSVSVYAGTFKGVFRYDELGDFWIHLPEPAGVNRRQITALEPGADEGEPGNYFWYGTVGQGVGRCATDRVNWQSMAGGLTLEGVETLEIDGDMIWAGFGYKGGYLDLLKNDFLHIGNYNIWSSQVLEHVSYMEKNGPYIFLGAYTGMAFYKTGTSPRWKVFQKAEGREIRGVNDIEKFEDGYLVGTGSGIKFLDMLNVSSGPELKDVDLAKNKYVSTLDYFKPWLFVGTLRYGMLCFRRSEGIWQKEGGFSLETPGLITSTLKIDSSTLVVGTRNNGVFILDINKGAKENSPPWLLKNHLGQNILRENYVTALAREGDWLWVGTRQSGICIYNTQNGQRYYLTDSNGLLTNKISTIKVAASNIWVGDALGICRIRRDSLAHYVYNKMETVL